MSAVRPALTAQLLEGPVSWLRTMVLEARQGLVEAPALVASGSGGACGPRSRNSRCCGQPGAGCQSFLRHGEVAWSGSAAARRAQSTARPRGRGHDSWRARRLAAPESPGLGQAADGSVAQAVVHQDNDLACRGQGGHGLALSVRDAVAMGLEELVTDPAPGRSTPWS